MKKIILFTSVLLFIAAGAKAQDTSYAAISRAFQDFRYEQVILLSERVLLNKTGLSDRQIIDILRMKAISHYALNEEALAAEAIRNIINRDPGFELDPVRNSPKIIAFYESIKKSYHPPPPAETKTDSIRPVQTQHIAAESLPLRGTLLRSFVLPGWGHLSLNEKKKGYLFAGAGVLTLGPLIYYSLQVARLENRYLNETDPAKIESRYNDFNQAYKIRNICLGAYALVWIYAQLDLTSVIGSYPAAGEKIRIMPDMNSGGAFGMQLHINF